MICFERGLFYMREELVAGWPSKTGLAVPNRLSRWLLSVFTLSGASIMEAQTALVPSLSRGCCLGPLAPLQRDTLRTQAFEVSSHSLTPVSIHTNHRAGRRVVDWPVGAGLAGPRSARGRQCTNVPPYQGRTSPPVDPSPKVPSPMSPKFPRYPCTAPFPRPLSILMDGPAHAMCGLSLAGPEPDWGPRDRPPPGPGR